MDITSDESLIYELYVSRDNGKSWQTVLDNSSISMPATLDEAVHAAYGQANAGDIVLFSPACASFDMFRNYEERGKTFKALVNALKEENEKKNK